MRINFVESTQNIIFQSERPKSSIEKGSPEIKPMPRKISLSSVNSENVEGKVDENANLDFIQEEIAPGEKIFLFLSPTSYQIYL